jgi:L-ascorbate metabolism protein UlaG (beta-lactamase superfamily)
MRLDPSEIETYPIQEGIAIWFLGGPSLAIRTPQMVIYLDLFTGPSPVPVVTKAIPEVIDPEAIRRADLAISTHHDEDHCDRHSLSWLHRNTTTEFLGPVSCNRLYQEWDFDPARTRQIAADENLSFGDVTIYGLPAKDVFDPDAVSYVIEGGGVTLFDGGDSLYFPAMAEIGERWELDLAILSYAKSPPDKVIYLDEDAVLKAAKDLRPRVLILKHYDLWQEFAVDPIPLVESLKLKGIDARVFGLGERFEYHGAA